MAPIREEYERGLAMLRRVHLLGDTEYDLMIKAMGTDMASSFMQNGGPNIVDWLSRLAQSSFWMDNDQKEYLEVHEKLNQIQEQADSTF